VPSDDGHALETAVTRAGKEVTRVPHRAGEHRFEPAAEAPDRGGQRQAGQPSGSSAGEEESRWCGEVGAKSSSETYLGVAELGIELVYGHRAQCCPVSKVFEELDKIGACRLARGVISARRELAPGDRRRWADPLGGGAPIRGGQPPWRHTDRRERLRRRPAAPQQPRPIPRLARKLPQRRQNSPPGRATSSAATSTRPATTCTEPTACKNDGTAAAVEGKPERLPHSASIRTLSVPIHVPASSLSPHRRPVSRHGDKGAPRPR